ncbi:hypothetical protein BOX15_Mlig026305g3 [Macrostomum lignano]|uniref:MFS domain-containing protein n=1 Tax=Macrostomum lignano TaxID=282301 RepID=A0A267FYM5_9PLAT|nr:hypothetical protein BOX15_Mlig026305g3 [Macrostomum lignano]
MPSTESSGSLGESTELLTPGRRSRMSGSSKVSVAMLLVMKLCGNMYENQMATFDVKAFNQTAANAGICVYEKQTPTSMLNIVVIAMAIAALCLPTLGGLLSDAFLGCLRTLWIGVGLQLCGSAMLTAFDSAGLICRMPMYLLAWVPVLLFLGFSDSLTLYAPMQIATSSRTRQLLLCLYFFAAATGETIGNVPSMLKYFTERSYEYLCVVFAVCSFLCLTVLTLQNKDAVLRHENVENFVMPRRKRLIKFYLIAAGTIPHLASIVMCRITLYWYQIRLFTHAYGDKDVLAYFIPLGGYQTATISLSLLGAAAIYKLGAPGWASLMTRIRAGLCLMTASKVPLMLLSLLDFHQVISMESWSSVTVWTVYFVSAFCDGVTNVLTTMAIYEMIYRIADAGTKATMVGIFYTVWGLAVFLNGAILLSLQACNVLHLDLNDRVKPKSHYAYGCVICLLLIEIAYWEKISWPLASGLLSDHEAEEAEGQDGPQLSSFAGRD